MFQVRRIVHKFFGSPIAGKGEFQSSLGNVWWMPFCGFCRTLYASGWPSWWPDACIHSSRSWGPLPPSDRISTVVFSAPCASSVHVTVPSSMAEPKVVHALSNISMHWLVLSLFDDGTVYDLNKLDVFEGR